MQNQPNRNLRKYLIIFSGLIILVLCSLFVWNFYHTGTIIILTNSSKNSITLTRINANNVGGASSVIKSNGQLSATVGLGRYDATVNNRHSSSSKLIVLGSHKTLRYSLNLNNLLNTQPVLNAQAQDIAVSSNHLVYLNTYTDEINEINSANNLSIINTSYPLQTVKWANANFGVGENSQQNLYIINNGSVSLLNLPRSSSKITTYDVSSNMQIYVVIGKKIYIGDQNGNFKKLYTTTSLNMIIGGSVNKAAVAYDSNSSDSNGSNVMLCIVNSSGQVVKTNIGEDVSSLVWSSNGQYLASVSESSIRVFNSSLKLLALIPTSIPADYLSWLNNNNFVYENSNQIWSYNLSSSRADLLTKLPLDNIASGLAVSNDGSYIYSATDDSINNTNSAILKIGLKGQQAPTIAYQLEDMLPMTLTDCSISLINFSQTPTILIQPSSLSNGLSQNYYIQEAESEIQQLGFSIKQLNFVVGPAN